MTEKFVASNGIPVFKSEDGEVGVRNRLMYTPRERTDAIREFFQHERDRELGRWRWPKNPDFVVYSREATGHTDRTYMECSVVEELTGYTQGFGSDLPQCHGGNFREAARAYFAAHPEPKPWHDAKPGEVWAIVTENVAEEVAVQRTPNGLWQFCDGVVRDDELPIVSARRIWPVSDV